MIGYITTALLFASAVSSADRADMESPRGAFAYAGDVASAPDIEIVRESIETPLRDGVTLTGHVYRPAAQGRYPTILVRTIYGREPDAEAYGAQYWARRGYAFVVQDVRGKGGSSGEFEPWVNEQADGYDSVEWVARQSWSNGRVGMLGGSYLGAVQWAAASLRPPSLVTMAILPAISDPFYGGPYDHGVLSLTPFWAYENGRRQARPEPDYDPQLLDTLPLVRLDDAVFGEDVPTWNRYLERDRRSEWTTPRWPEDLCRSTVPTLIFYSLWDGDGTGPVLNWEARRTCGDDDAFVMGPWGHSTAQTGRRGDVEYGALSRIELGRVLVNWFARHLQNSSSAEIPQARVFVTGENEWRAFEAWPPLTAERRDLHLSPDGSLTDSPPVQPGQSAIEYGPEPIGRSFEDAAFVRTTLMPPPQFDGDQLMFVTEPFAAPVALGGSPRLRLTMSPGDQDADVFAFLVDIAPDGTARVVAQPGKQRLSYRGGADARQLVAPGETLAVNVRVPDFAHRFDAGHRLGVILRSEWFPRWSRNPGGAALATATDLHPATHQVIFGDGRANLLELSVLPD